MRPILLILPISESPICRYNLSGSEAHPNSPVRATNVVIVDMRSTDLTKLLEKDKKGPSSRYFGELTF